MITKNMREELEEWIDEKPSWLYLYADGVDVEPCYTTQLTFGSKVPETIYTGTDITIRCKTAVLDKDEPLVRLKEEV